MPADALDALRTASHPAIGAADPGPVLAALAALPAAELPRVAQHAGDALLCLPALLRPADAVVAVLDALRGRGWPGDEALAGLLADGGSGGGEHAHKLPVDLDELAGGGTVSTPAGPLDVPAAAAPAAPAAAPGGDPVEQAERRRGATRAWLAERGYAAVPPAALT